MRLLGSTCQHCVTPKPSRGVYRYYLQSLARELLPDERTADCLRGPVPGAPGVFVMHSPQVKSAHYKNLLVCARVWLCAVCSSKITERRRQELTHGVERSEYSVLLLTYTLRHNADDDLRELLKAILAAYRRIKSGKAWKTMTRNVGLVGDVRALEVTHGDNGWHPHIHVLTLIERDLPPDTLEYLENTLKRRWGAILAGLGHDASWHAGVDVRTAKSDIAEYILKYGRLPQKTGWTVEHEITKQPTKKGRHAGRTPMQLLSDYGDGDKLAGELFVEYSVAFKGRHQLQWSRGLRELLGMNETEKTDEELANEETEPASILAILTRKDWQVIVGNDARAELLDIAATGDEFALADFLATLGILHVSEVIRIAGD